MSLKLHFGVIELPYTHDKSGSTTGEVAEILEGKYKVMETFYDRHAEEIAGDLEQSVAGALENLIATGRKSNKPFEQGTSSIERRFKQFLATGEIERIGIEGVPTKAALERRSSRFKKKRAKNKRPSFIDTGLYQSAFKAWIVET